MNRILVCYSTDECLIIQHFFVTSFTPSPTGSSRLQCLHTKSDIVRRIHLVWNFFRLTFTHRLFTSSLSVPHTLFLLKPLYVLSPFDFRLFVYWFLINSPDSPTWISGLPSSPKAILVPTHKVMWSTLFLGPCSSEHTDPTLLLLKERRVEVEVKESTLQSYVKESRRRRGMINPSSISSSLSNPTTTPLAFGSVSTWLSNLSVPINHCFDPDLSLTEDRIMRKWWFNGTL